MFLKTFTGSLHPSVSRFPASDSEVRAGILNSKRSENGKACAPVMPVEPRSSDVSCPRPARLEQSKSHG